MLFLVNIHSHLWGAVLFAFFLTDFYRHMDIYPTTNVFDAAGFVIFLISAVICLSFSASYHTFNCHSKKVGIATNLWTLKKPSYPSILDPRYFPYFWLFRNYRWVLNQPLPQTTRLNHDILVLIVGSFFPSIYYGFYCTPYIQAMYLSAICLAGGGRLSKNGLNSDNTALTKF